VPPARATAGAERSSAISALGRTSMPQNFGAISLTARACGTRPSGRRGDARGRSLALSGGRVAQGVAMHERGVRASTPARALRRGLRATDRRRARQDAPPVHDLEGAKGWRPGRLPAIGWIDRRSWSVSRAFPRGQLRVRTEWGDEAYGMVNAERLAIACSPASCITKFG